MFILFPHAVYIRRETDYVVTTTQTRHTAALRALSLRLPCLITRRKYDSVPMAPHTKNSITRGYYSIGCCTRTAASRPSCLIVPYIRL